MEALEEEHDFGGRTSGMEETVHFAKKNTTITESFYNVNIIFVGGRKNALQRKHATNKAH